MDQGIAHAVPEILAPAGGTDALRAAVENGADAVYLGLSSLNARRGAENFTLGTLSDATRYAHLRGVRVYLTANIVVLQDEMAGALDLVARAWEAGVDAVIVQDLGLLRCVARMLPEVRLHASTQIDAHNIETVRLLASMGVSRVTLARELSVDEISGLAAESPVELESFVHGSLCFSHSGQCLMSSMIGGRSANRGLCAQPCRMPYDLVAEDGRTVDAPGKYLLSPRDLAGITVLPALVATGVAALKIEGRMKSPEYVATVVRVYRSALDRALADPCGYQVSASEWDLLSEAFSRGFSEAYLSDIRDDAMMSHSRPNNRGVQVGRVVSTASGRFTVALDRAVESRDTLEFWTGSGRFVQPAGTLKVEGREVAAAPAGAKAEILGEGAARPGDRVFRVANAALLDAARRSYQGREERKPTPVDFRVRLRLGLPVEVTAEAAGHSVTVTGPVAEEARTRPVSAEDVIEHVGRTGGTGYVVGGWRIDLDPAVGVGFSLLHHLRREALEGLDALRLAPWSGRSLPRDLAPPLPPSSSPARIAPEIVAAVSDPAVAAACLEAGADRVLMAVTAADAGTPLPPGCDVLLPRVAHPADIEALEGIAHGHRVTSGNLGVLGALVGRGAPGVSADWGLNAVQPWSVAALAEAGADMVWASPEVSGRQLKELCSGASVRVGAVVHGKLELMTAEHCVLQSAGACGRRCETCARRRGRWVLVDRKGYRFPVTSDSAGHAHIYNAVTLDLSRALSEVVGAGVSALRLELHLESPHVAARLVRAYRSLLADTIAGKRPPSASLADPATSGHFFRGLA